MVQLFGIHVVICIFGGLILFKLDQILKELQSNDEEECNK